jgi:hypothetical protein
MKFYCPHPEVEEAEAYQEIKTLLNDNSTRREGLGPGNSDLWQAYWDLKWTKYLALVKAFQTTINKQIPRAKEVKQELLGLKNAAEELEMRLDKISNQAIAHVLFDETNEAFEIYCRLKDDLEKFSNVVSKAVQAIPKDKGGRPENFYLKEFIKRLAQLWQGVTSRKPTVPYNPIDECYYGPFLKFVQLSCNLAGFEYQSTNALAQTVKRTLPN